MRTETTHTLHDYIPLLKEVHTAITQQHRTYSSERTRVPATDTTTCCVFKPLMTLMRWWNGNSLAETRTSAAGTTSTTSTSNGLSAIGTGRRDVGVTSLLDANGRLQGTLGERSFVAVVR